MELIENKLYERIQGTDNIASLFSEGYLRGYSINTELLRKLSRELGFQYDTYLSIAKLYKEAADSIIADACKKSNREELTLLIDTESESVLGYSLESNRTPLLNTDFLKRLYSSLEDCSFLDIKDVYYSREDLVSSAIIKRKSPIVVEEKYEGKPSKFTEYEIGVLIVNDELNNTYCRLVLYMNKQPIYLPPVYYNVTTSRYKKSTQDSQEALEVLLLKVIEDLREDELSSKLYDLHFSYRANKDILASYEEYNIILRTMRKIPTVIEDNSYIAPLLSKYDDFEDKYSILDSQKSSYIWRCTALGELTIGTLIFIATGILNDMNAPALECYNIRELLGSYVSTDRIAAEIAKENI